MLYKVNLVGKNSNANSVKVLAAGNRDGFKSITLRKEIQPESNNCC
jgi:hypothetical protein